VPLNLLSGEGLPTGVEARSLALHDKNPALGEKVMQYAARVWLEADDANGCVEGEEVTLMRWGNAIVTALHRDAAGRVVSADGTLHLAGDFKKTKKKITWVADTPDVVPVSLVEFDFLITKSKIEDGEDFTKFINETSRAEVRPRAHAQASLSQEHPTLLSPYAPQPTSAPVFTDALPPPSMLVPVVAPRWSSDASHR
jgi:glutamyl-tRNA synthetase